MVQAISGFWGPYRRVMVETMLADGETRKAIAAKLGVSRQALDAAIHYHRLKARPLEASDG